MKARHARRIRAGIAAARFEAERGWRVRLHLDDRLAARAAHRERRRLIRARPNGRHALAVLPIDWQEWAS